MEIDEKRRSGFRKSRLRCVGEDHGMALVIAMDFCRAGEVFKFELDQGQVK